VMASAASPTSLAYPGKGPMKKHIDPKAKQSAIQRRRVTSRDPLRDSAVIDAIGEGEPP
jgi:hypothetical protein